MKDVLDIELFSETTSQVELIYTDITGRMIMHKQLDVHRGTNRFSFNTGNSSKGIYCLYAVSKTGKSNMIKFVK